MTQKNGAQNSNWRGITDNGYMLIYMPEHPRARPNGYVLEHIVIAEKALGKPLPKRAEVHHHGEKDDNTQLVICQDRSYHRLLHQRINAIRACGHVNWRKCKYCKQYDKPENLYIGNGHVYHQSCNAHYNRQLYLKTKKEGAT